MSSPTYSDSESEIPLTFPRSKRHSSSGSGIRKPAADLITALPDSVLGHVLSFLPIEDAIRSQILSKRWQYLWTYSTSLVFRDSNSSDKSVSDFVTFVDRTLVLCACSKVTKLGVQFAYEPDYASNVNLWTRFAAGRGAEELQLDLFSECKVMPKGVVCWHSLKKLSIGRAKLSEDVIQKILAGSPVLEILELCYCYGFNRVHVSDASLKKLILRDGDYDDDGDGGHHPVLEISAPHLHSLEITGDLGRKICRLGDVSSLVDANISFRIWYRYYCSDDYKVHTDMFAGLLQSLVHVKKITLGSWAIQVLSIMEAKGLHSPLLKCECLTLDTDIRKKVLPGIAHMLDSSRNLETLVISSAPYHCHEDFWDELCNVGEKHYWTSTEKSFMCLMFCLQKVKLIGFGLCKVDYYLPFVQFLLKNARVLQKMVIDAQTGGCNWPKEFSQAAQKLLSFPRSSPNAVVLFCE
ncbi:F-box protein At5g03100-like isoform X2 [Rhododendron vialii]|uniref:F-box protein At5g03100-like isoform X2 n=1 Tax=Rhododendron vialii TaxID=182163 RepID=UPI002660508C|nr:F-box protein At5g03100-like isoform X2 [Rhododendron vialii]